MPQVGYRAVQHLLRRLRLGTDSLIRTVVIAFSLVSAVIVGGTTTKWLTDGVIGLEIIVAISLLYALIAAANRARERAVLAGLLSILFVAFLRRLVVPTSVGVDPIVMLPLVGAVVLV